MGKAVERYSWVVGRVGTRYSTPPGIPTLYPTLVRTHPHAGAAVHTTTSTPDTAHMTLLDWPKEILGVDNAQVF